MRGIGIKGAGMIPVSMQGGGQGGVFSPADIADLRLWLKADAGIFTDDAATTPATADGDVIAVWQDQSGNGYHVSQTDNAKRPLLKLGANGINGRACIKFDGADDILVRTVANWLSGDSAGSVFMVYRLTAPLQDNNWGFCSADQVVDTRYIGFQPILSAANPNVRLSQSNADVADIVRGNTVLAATTTYLVTWRSDGAAWTIRVNAVDQVLAVTGANSGDWFADTANRDNFSVGALKRTTESLFSKSSIAEIIVCGSNKTGADLTNIETYLNGRYSAF